MNKGVLIIGETVLQRLHRISFELLGKGRELADKLNCSLDCLLIAENCDDAYELNRRGADTIYIIKSQSFANPEEFLFKANIVEFIKEKKPSIILIGATHLGRSLAPRIACALHTGLTADCTDLQIDEEGRLIQIRPAFSDNILAHIKTKKFPQIATIRYNEFPEAVRKAEDIPANIKIIKPYSESYTGTKIIEVTSKHGADLSEASIIVCGGRGFKKEEDLKLLESLAESVNGMVGYSRALVDAGMANSSYQIGYSGVRVKPTVYIACGVSGAPQHIAGMKESGKIIAINSDATAPIFNICDYGYVGDLYSVIPRLVNEFSKIKGCG